jgi:hypothetical protein
MNTNKMMMLGLMVMIAAAAVSVFAAENGSVKVTAPGSAKVWIDDKPVSGSASLPEGTHTIKVVKEGASSGLMRTVVVKPKANLDVAVDFEKKAINVKNAAALGYTPTEGATVNLITLPKESEAPAEKPGAAAGAEPEKGKAGPAEGPSNYRACAPGEWCPEPVENEVGPPAPPGKDKHPVAGPGEKPGPITPPEIKPETKPGATAEKKPEPVETKPETEPVKKPPEIKKEPLAGSTVKKPVAAPCKLKGSADTCAYYGGRDDVRETLFTYYCNLANHDLDAAYKYWTTDPTRDAGWFYESSANFCKVEDYRIQNLDISKPSESQAKATYTLELLDGRGQIIEIRKMTAVLNRKTDVWSIKTNTREAPPAKPGETKTATKPPAPKKPVTKAAETKSPATTSEAAKPKETTAPETKPPETKPTETKIPETKATAPKTPATKPTATKPAAKPPVTKPKDTKAPETKSTVTKPPEPKPPEPKPMTPPAPTPPPAAPPTTPTPAPARP